ncbi:Uma2 family endonuclease [Streptomyces rugosispiralis]|uniref:Uma2 family endonuclease n=1 Tax=Streptomyces rugosispiralis TaxID=2967341 RepID=A0ABT1UVU6_9ACTN|nr:Uma2 family endonuclease [Streptomyces rugosispiralis]MCQ8189242.1 Uma2 family endonuclease [Streptomyces rugosispiralis]
MTAPLPDQEFVNLLDIHAQLELPDGMRAELIGGEIVISPTPANFHNWIFSELNLQLVREVPTQWRITNTTTVFLPATEERFIPDLLICESEALKSMEEWQVEASDVLLVAEITSPSTRARDLGAKVKGYAHSNVPIYLLIDPHHNEGSTTVYSAPDGKGRYRDEHRAAFGEPVTLPEPLGLTLDTAGFLK